MKYKIDELEINARRYELEKLIEEKSFNLLIEEIINKSKELDKLICSLLFSENIK